MPNLHAAIHSPSQQLPKDAFGSEIRLSSWQWAPLGLGNFSSLQRKWIISCGTWMSTNGYGRVTWLVLSEL